MLVATVLAAARPGAAPEQGRIYIPAGSVLHYSTVEAPLPARQLGPIALAAADRLGDPQVSIPGIMGELPAGLLPAGWPARTLAGADQVRAGAAPLGARSGAAEPCQCETVIGDTARARIAALYATRAFTVGQDIDQVHLLQLRARYRDGLTVYLNGREVARRNLPPDAGPMDMAVRPHGPEWETFFIPVVPGMLVRGDNLLALEVRPSAQRLAPELDLELSSVERARIVRGPMVQQVGETSAMLVFETDLPAQAVVEYGPTAERGQVAPSAGGGLAMRHEVRLTGLAAGKPVHYRVLAGGHTTEPSVFHTAPADREVLRFVVYGDVRGGHDVHGKLIEAIQGEAPDLVLVTGDLVLRGTDEADWQRFFAVTARLLARVPYYPAVGNHDTGMSGEQGRRMNEIFALWPPPEDRPVWGHWYSFDVAGVHFVMLDSNAYQHDEQLTWLERDLRSARSRRVRAIFAVTHDGPYSRGMHGGNAYAAERYAPVLARYGVTLLFSGHDHLYQRGMANGLAYMVSGGGGAPLYNARCGVPGRRPCPTSDGMQHLASEHHYVAVTVYREHVEACPRRADGSPVEPCVIYRLRSPGR